MEYSIEKHQSCVVITFKGKVMGGPDAVKLNEQLHELIENDQVNVIADLGKVKFMNSSGLGMLIGGLTTMRKAGGDLRLANITEKIEHLLTVTKLTTVFNHFNTLNEAVASYSKAE